MARQWVTNIIYSNVTTYAAPFGVRLELDDDIRGTYNVILYGRESLQVGIALIRTYLAHCVFWWREQIFPSNDE